jgi:hypothetical protein
LKIALSGSGIFIEATSCTISPSKDKNHDLRRCQCRLASAPVIHTAAPIVGSYASRPLLKYHPPSSPLQHDQARAEDMDSNLEDHAADEWRYACMSRPWIKTVKEKRPERVKDAYERAVRESDSYRTA